MPDYNAILAAAFDRATTDITQPLVQDSTIRDHIHEVSHNTKNRALVRLLLTCSLAKISNPKMDARSPYTEISGERTFAGRPIDEGYVWPFVSNHKLPCNPTTAFLTPALRNITVPLSSSTNYAGTPKQLYITACQVLESLENGEVTASDVLSETLRALVMLKNEQQQKLQTLLSSVEGHEEGLPLSSEMILQIISSHLKGKGASRLPVLVVAAAYGAAGALIGEEIKPLKSHNAADKQTGSIGDVEVTLIRDDKVVTGYEMKLKAIATGDIDLAVEKIFDKGINNYIFITTEPITQEVNEYAASFYEKTGGVEIVVLDCLSFLRHFLHFFHRYRAQYVDAYQKLVLTEPDSAVSQTLKRLWLSLRQNAESSV